MNDFAFIGDIHGALGPLMEILPKAERLANHIVFLGDYINRGNDSRRVLAELVAFKSKNLKRSTFLYGHHELALIDALKRNRSEDFLRMGGAATLRQYPRRSKTGDLLSLTERFPPEQRQFLTSLKPSFSSEGVAATHCEAWASSDVGQFGVYGHQPQDTGRPNISEYRALIDTGCGTLPNGRLTCFLWPSREWIQTS